MRAIILAAGKGSRISGQIGDMPKSLLKIKGKSILLSTVDKLLDKGYDVSICVGYRHELIETELNERNIQFYYNPFYELANNISSLWFARSEFYKDDDVIVLSADVIFEPSVLDKLVQSDYDLTMATDSSRILDGDYFFSLDAEGRIAGYGPEVPIPERDAEYMGLSKIHRNMVTVFARRLEKMIEEGNLQCYFENVFFSFIGDRTVNLKTIDIAGMKWREIDFYDDYQKALTQFM